MVSPRIFFLHFDLQLPYSCSIVYVLFLLYPDSIILFYNQYSMYFDVIITELYFMDKPRIVSFFY